MSWRGPFPPPKPKRPTGFACSECGGSHERSIECSECEGWFCEEHALLFDPPRCVGCFLGEVAA